MGYAEAKAIREKSLSNRIAGRLVGGESITSSIGKSISEGTKAKIKGLKEKINPMNIAKFMTGGSNLAAALTGRMMGASKEDMKYFAGKSGPGKDTASKIKPGIEQEEGVINLLSDILSLLEDSRLKREKDKPTEEDISEKERKAENRHRELLKALGVQPGEKPTAEKVEEDDGFLSSLKNILGWFKSPVGIWLLGLGSMAALFGALYLGLQALNKITPNMKALSPQEAENILKNGSARDIEALGGREKLEDIIKNGKERALAIQNMPEGEEKRKAELAMGGADKVKQIAEDKTEYKVPTNIDTGPDKVPPRPDTTGGKNAGRAKMWDNKFGDKYNPDGTKKSATPVSTEQPNQPKQPTEVEKKSAPVPAEPTPAAAPEKTEPASAKLNSVVKENLDANLPISNPDAAASQTVNNTTINQTKQTTQAVTGIPSVRNQEPTFQDMLLYSTRVV